MTFTLGEIAGLIAAGALLILVGLAAIPLVKLGKVLDSLTELVRDLNTSSVPILHELKGTVVATNDEITKLGVVTTDVAKVSGSAATVGENAAQLSTLLSAAVGRPLVKVAAFNYGIKRAVAAARAPKKAGK